MTEKNKQSKSASSRRSSTVEHIRKRKGASKKPKTRQREAVRDTNELPELHATVAATTEQYEEIVRLLWEGTGIFRPQKTIATMIQLEANTGLRIGDIAHLRLNDIIRDGDRYRFYMREHKTKKIRSFTVPDPVYHMLEKYAKANGVGPEERLFNVGERNVQKKLQAATSFLGYKHISSHSFRKYFCTQAYHASGGDLEVCRKLLQHSTQAITLRYLGIGDEKVEKTLKKITNIVATY